MKYNQFKQGIKIIQISNTKNSNIKYNEFKYWIQYKEFNSIIQRIQILNTKNSDLEYKQFKY